MLSRFILTIDNHTIYTLETEYETCIHLKKKIKMNRRCDEIDIVAKTYESEKNLSERSCYCEIGPQSKIQRTGMYGKNGGPRKQKPWKAKLTYVPNSIYALEMVPKRFITSVQ